jgi:hypothetical protein
LQKQTSNLNQVLRSGVHQVGQNWNCGHTMAMAGSPFLYPTAQLQFIFYQAAHGYLLPPDNRLDRMKATSTSQLLGGLVSGGMVFIYTSKAM